MPPKKSEWKAGKRRGGADKYRRMARKLKGEKLWSKRSTSISAKMNALLVQKMSEYSVKLQGLIYHSLAYNFMMNIVTKARKRLQTRGLRTEGENNSNTGVRLTGRYGTELTTFSKRGRERGKERRTRMHEIESTTWTKQIVTKGQAWIIEQVCPDHWKMLDTLKKKYRTDRGCKSESYKWLQEIIQERSQKMERSICGTCTKIRQTVKERLLDTNMVQQTEYVRLTDDTVGERLTGSKSTVTRNEYMSCKIGANIDECSMIIRCALWDGVQKLNDKNTDLKAYIYGGDKGAEGILVIQDQCHCMTKYRTTHRGDTEGFVLEEYVTVNRWINHNCREECKKHRVTSEFSSYKSMTRAGMVAQTRAAASTKTDGESADNQEMREGNTRKGKDKKGTSDKNAPGGTKEMTKRGGMKGGGQQEQKGPTGGRPIRGRGGLGRAGTRRRGGGRGRKIGTKPWSSDLTLTNEQNDTGNEEGDKSEDEEEMEGDSNDRDSSSDADKEEESDSNESDDEEKDREETDSDESRDGDFNHTLRTSSDVPLALAKQKWSAEINKRKDDINPDKGVDSPLGLLEDDVDGEGEGDEERREDDKLNEGGDSLMGLLEDDVNGEEGRDEEMKENNKLNEEDREEGLQKLEMESANMIRLKEGESEDNGHAGEKAPKDPSDKTKENKNRTEKQDSGTEKREKERKKAGRKPKESAKEEGRKDTIQTEALKDKGKRTTSELKGRRNREPKKQETKEEAALRKRERRRLSNLMSQRRHRARMKLLEESQTPEQGGDKRNKKEKLKTRKDKGKAKIEKSKKGEENGNRNEAKMKCAKDKVEGSTKESVKEKIDPPGHAVLPQRWRPIKLRVPTKNMTNPQMEALLKYANEKGAAGIHMSNEELNTRDLLRDTLSGKVQRERNMIQSREVRHAAGMFSPAATSTKTPPADKQSSASTSFLKLPEGWLRMLTDDLRGWLKEYKERAQRYGLSSRERMMYNALDKMLAYRDNNPYWKEWEEEDIKRMVEKNKQKKEAERRLEREEEKRREKEKVARNEEDLRRQDADDRRKGGYISDEEEKREPIAVRIDSRSSSDTDERQSADESDESDNSEYDRRSVQSGPKATRTIQSDEESVEILEEKKGYRDQRKEGKKDIDERAERIKYLKKDIKNQMIGLEDQKDLMQREAELQKIEIQRADEYRRKMGKIKEHQARLARESLALKGMMEIANKATYRPDNETPEQAQTRRRYEKEFRNRLLAESETIDWETLNAEDKEAREEMLRRERAGSEEQHRKERIAEATGKWGDKGEAAKVDEKEMNEDDEKEEEKRRQDKKQTEMGRRDREGQMFKGYENTVGLTAEQKKKRMRDLNDHHKDLAAHYGDRKEVRAPRNIRYVPYTEYEVKKLKGTIEASFYEQEELEEGWNLYVSPTQDAEIKLLKRAVAHSLGAMKCLHQNVHSLATMHELALTEMLENTIVWKGSGLTVMDPEWKMAQLFDLAINKITHPPSLKEQLQISCFTFKWSVAEDLKVEANILVTCRTREMMLDSAIRVTCQSQEAARWIKIRLNDFYVKTGGRLLEPYRNMSFTRAWGPGIMDMQYWARATWNNVMEAVQEMKRQGIQRSSDGRQTQDIESVELVGIRMTDMLIVYKDSQIEAVNYCEISTHRVLRVYTPKMNSGYPMPEPLDLGLDYAVMQNHVPKMNGAFFGLEKIQFHEQRDHEGTLPEEKYWRQHDWFVLQQSKQAPLQTGTYGMKFTTSRHRGVRAAPYKDAGGASGTMKGKGDRDGAVGQQNVKQKKETVEKEKKIEQEKKKEAEKEEKDQIEKEETVEKAAKNEEVLEQLMKAVTKLQEEKDKDRTEGDQEGVPRKEKRKHSKPRISRDEDGDSSERDREDEEKTKKGAKKRKYSDTPEKSKSEEDDRGERVDRSVDRDMRGIGLNTREPWRQGYQRMTMDPGGKLMEDGGLPGYMLPGYMMGRNFGGNEGYAQGGFRPEEVYRGQGVYRRN